MRFKKRLEDRDALRQQFDRVKKKKVYQEFEFTDEELAAMQDKGERYEF